MFFGTTVNASRAVANQVNSAVHGFAGNFLVATFPQITKTYAAENYEEFYSLMIRGAKFSYFILAILMIPLLLNMDYILELWLKTPPVEASIFCQLILVSELIRIVSEPLYTGIQATGHVKDYQIWTSSLTLLLLPVCCLLYKIGYPAYMAFVVLVICSLIIVICRVFFLGKLTDFPIGKYIRCLLINCFGVSLIGFVPLYFLNQQFPSDFIHFFGISLLSFIWSGGVFFILSMTRGERKFIINGVKTRFHRI
jgi:O-antigen/teichoic acid export membrane protein